MKPAAFLSLLACSCVLSEPDVEVDETVLASESDNALSLNALSLNALSLNALSLNALSLNALSLNSFKLNAELADQFDGDGSAAVLRYVAKCALASGSELVADAGTFAGLFGVADGWVDGALDKTARRWLTACLLAHANDFGISVPISVRAPNSPSDVSEWLSYGVYEASFYGDMFAKKPKLYACLGTTKEHACDDSSYRDLRVCGDPEKGNKTECSIGEVQVKNLGPMCKDVCETFSLRDGWRDCRGKRDGEIYAEVMSSWLIDDIHDQKVAEMFESWSSSWGSWGSSSWGSASESDDD